MFWIFNFIQIITLIVQFNWHVLYLEAVLPNVDFWNKINMYVCMYVDHHDTIQDIQRECTAVLNATPQKEYSDCFQKLVNQFQLCIDSEGDYFE
jgi:hypothetical protein